MCGEFSAGDNVVCTRKMGAKGEREKDGYDKPAGHVRIYIRESFRPQQRGMEGKSNALRDG